MDNTLSLAAVDCLKSLRSANNKSRALSLLSGAMEEERRHNDGMFH